MSSSLVFANFFLKYLIFLSLVLASRGYIFGFSILGQSDICSILSTYGSTGHRHFRDSLE